MSAKPKIIDSLAEDDIPLSSPLQIKKYFNLKLKSFINISLLAVLLTELIMPHKIFAQELLKDSNKFGAKYNFPELALSSDVYAFNDKFVPEEIELQRQAEERKKAGATYSAAEMVVSSTAYSSTVDQCDDDPFIAASGKRVHDGMVAANFLKFNTKIRIPELFGDKIFVVEDRMNPRFQNRIDIWMGTREEAIQYGFRKVRIEILETIK
ncbi:MAG: 3D domain-containing protein [bacterium]